MNTGTIRKIRGSWASGLASVTIEKDDGAKETLYADNGPLVRALDQALGGKFITEGHTFDPTMAEGLRIVYEADDIGVLEWFAPEEGEAP